MKKFILLLVGCMVLLSSCVSLKTSQKEVNYPSGIDRLFHSSNMVYYQGDYWILGVPETSDILAKVIEKKNITIEDRNYEYYEIYGDSVFESPLSTTDIIKENVYYQRQEEIKTDTETGLVLLAYLTGSAKTINQIKDHKLIENAYYFRPDGHTVKEKYRDSNLYFVSKYYIGVLSYYGTSELNIEASLAASIGSVKETATTVSSLSELKKGIIAIRLSPIKSLIKKSIIEYNYNDLIESGYIKLKDMP